MAISREFIQDLHEKLDIEDVISSYVTLKRTGKSLKGLCPFHNEKTPSFTVYPDTKSFYCFGCGASGDVISFIMRMDNLDYVEAVKAAAEQAGMSMPDDGYDDSFAKRRMRILGANREAAKFYNTQLFAPENTEALRYYTEKRRLTKATITHYGLGYAPDSWRSLTDYLKSKGYSEQELILAGLARRKDAQSSCYDIFRNRMMFPIIDVRGNVIGFSGRRLNESDERKYVNTAETPVFTKGSNIFSLNFAKNSGRKFILVEGQMDVISLYQAGFENAIACLGTAFTDEQANLISRYADEVLICYDSDEAGHKATQKALTILGKTGLKLKVVNMEGGKDADEIVKTYGKERFRDILESSANEIEYRLSRERDNFILGTDDGRLKYLSAAAKILAPCNPIEKEIYTLRLATEFGINKDAFASQIKMEESRLSRQRAEDRKKSERKAVTKTFTDVNNPEKADNLKAARAEETLIASLMRNPDFYRKIEGKFTPDDFVTSFNKRIVTFLIELIRDGFPPELTMFSSEFTPDEMSSVTRISMLGDSLGNTLKECEDCIAILKSEGSKTAINPTEMTDEEFLELFRTKREEK